MKSGSYIFLIINESDFWSFNKSFQDAGFKVCDHASNILYKTSTLRCRRSVDFTQRRCEHALISKTMGTHPSGFQPDFISHQASNQGVQSHWVFASLTNAEYCTFKLMRPQKTTPVYPGERSISLFSRIIRMLSTCEGSVLDPFGGPLTSALACLQTGRTCTYLDSSNDAFRFAQSRRRIFATPNATMKELDVYLDPSSQKTCDEGKLRLP